MECELVDSMLTYFYFGSIDGAGRSACESHLLGCSTCLGEFLDFKRNVEVAPSSVEMPSPVLQATIRKRLCGDWGSGSRPKRRVIQSAAAALCAAVLVVCLFEWRSQSPARTDRERAAEIDTARGTAVSLNLL